jgi:hypothetical protein
LSSNTGRSAGTFPSEGDKNKQLRYAYISLWTQSGTPGYTLVHLFPHVSELAIYLLKKKSSKQKLQR